MLSIVICAVAASGSLGARFDGFVKTAQKQKKPILLITTEIKNVAWREVQKKVLGREDVKKMLKKVLVMKMPCTSKTRPKIAKYCGLKALRTPFFAFFDYEGKLVTFFSGKVRAGQLKASITSACAVSARRAKRPKTPRVWRKAQTSPEAAKLRVAEMYIRNNVLDAARKTLEIVAREYPGTPEAEKANRYLADLDAGRKPVVEEESRKPSGDAAKELRMARMLVMTKATDMAREKLQGIVANYPGSSEAEEARKLLSEME